MKRNIFEIILNVVVVPIFVIGTCISKLFKDVVNSFYKKLVAFIATVTLIYLISYFLK